MIVLDTNQLLFRAPDGNRLRTRAPDGTLLRMLRKVADQKKLDLVLPSMVVEEYLAHYRHDVDVTAIQARKSIRQLRDLASNWSCDPPPEGLADAAEETRRQQLAAMFSVHAAPAGAYEEGLRREAHRIRPAKVSWPDQDTDDGQTAGGGARDVVIWLTAIDACRTSEADTYFVTENSTDFGRDGTLWPELAGELGSDANRFHYCSSVPALIDRLGIKRSQPPDGEVVGNSALVLRALELALTNGEAFLELIQGIPNYTYRSIGAFEGVKDLTFVSLQDKPAGYELEDGSWAFVRGRWVGWKDFTVTWRPEVMDVQHVRPVHVDFAVTATVAVQIDPGGNIVGAEVTDRTPLEVTGTLLESRVRSSVGSEGLRPTAT